MSFDEFNEFLAVIERHNLSIDATAALIAASPHTVRLFLARRTPPKKKDAQGRISRWLAANRTAQSRGELRLLGD